MSWTVKLPLRGEGTQWDGGTTVWDPPSPFTIWDGLTDRWADRPPASGVWTKQPGGS